jgi:hypothetical protein
MVIVFVHSTHHHRSISVSWEKLEINVWDPDYVAAAIRGIVLVCYEYALSHYVVTTPPPTLATQITRFLEQVAHCVNMFYPERGEPVRPRLELGDVIIIFDNGITQQANRSNYPQLIVQGIPFRDIQVHEDRGITVQPAYDVCARITFRGDGFRFGDGVATVKSAIPAALAAEVL